MIPNEHNFRDYLWEHVPESRPLIEKLERDQIEFSGDLDSLSVYSYISLCFFHDLLVPALESRDLEAVAKYVGFVEELLASDDRGLVDAVEIRVAEKLREEWLPMVLSVAGPRLSSAIQCY